MNTPAAVAPLAHPVHVAAQRIGIGRTLTPLRNDDAGPHGISHNRIEDTKEEHRELCVAAFDRLAEKTIRAHS